ncbi:MAG: ABC transporter substrate-binding protein [Acetanaerobacterium sp.]
MKKRIISVLLAAVMVLTLAAGCTSQNGDTPSSTEPTPSGASEAGDDVGFTGQVKIGVVAPISGSAAMVGDTLIKGVELAAKQINTAGGVNGKEIVLYKEDDQQDPKTAVSAVNKLVSSDEVTAIIGTVNSSCTLAMMDVTESAGVPLITPIASGISVTDPSNSFIARLQASDVLQAKAVTEYALNDLGLTKIAVIYQSDDYGTGGKDVALQVLADNGIEPVAVEAFDPAATDMNSQLLKIKEAGAEALIMWTMYTPAANIARQAKQLGMEDLALMGGGGLTNAKLFELAQDAAVGICNTQTFFPDKSLASPAAAAFIEAYEAEYGVTPDSNAAMSYDAMMVLAEGLKASPELVNTEIMAGIKSVKNMALATGDISIDEKGDANRAILIIRLGEGGVYELVK